MGSRKNTPTISFIIEDDREMQTIYERPAVVVRKVPFEFKGPAGPLNCYPLSPTEVYLRHSPLLQEDLENTLWEVCFAVYRHNQKVLLEKKKAKTVSLAIDDVKTREPLVMFPARSSAQRAIRRMEFGTCYAGVMMCFGQITKKIGF